MGQQNSKHNEPFAFTGNNVLSTMALQVHDPLHGGGKRQIEEEEDQDLVLDNPDFYRLEYTKLAEDLAYIDQKYYEDADDDDPESATWRRRRRQSEEVRAEGLQEVTVDHRTMPSVAMDLTGRGLVRLGAGIGSLVSLTQLNLSHNQIRTLPNELGNLTHLRVLNLSYNRIVALPNSIHRLNRLRAVNVSHNQLHTLPASMCTLDDLCVLIVNNNSLVHLPYQLGRLKRLATFHIGDNPLLTSLPAEIADMPSIRKLMADHCGFPETVPLRLPHDPPSLVETCARQLIKLRYSNATGSSSSSSTRRLLHQQLQPRNIPREIAPYLATAKTCSVCKGPYFDACVRHHRMVDRSGTSIAIEYRLCSLHWTTEEDRLLYTFGCRQVMPDGVVDAYASDMQRLIAGAARHDHQQSSEEDTLLKQEARPGEDGYYYCRLVPSNTESLDSTVTTIPAQKGSSKSGSSGLNFFATRLL